MEIRDNKTGVPLEFYTGKFSESDPEEMSRRTGVNYENGEFKLDVYKRQS